MLRAGQEFSPSGILGTRLHFFFIITHPAAMRKENQEKFSKIYGHFMRRTSLQRRGCRQRRQNRGHAAESKLPRGMSSILHRIPPN